MTDALRQAAKSAETIGKATQGIDFKILGATRINNSGDDEFKRMVNSLNHNMFNANSHGKFQHTSHSIEWLFFKHKSFNFSSTLYTPSSIILPSWQLW